MSLGLGLLYAVAILLLVIGAVFRSGPVFGIGCALLVLAQISVRRADKHPDLIPPG